MAIYLGMSSLIIRRDAIEKNYPGGWNTFLIDECMKKLSAEYDNYLFRENTMGFHSKYPNLIGLVEEKKKKPYWKDYIILGQKIEGECDWLIVEEYKKDQFCAYMKGETNSKDEPFHETSLSLGLKYYMGTGVSKNFETAYLLFQQGSQDAVLGGSSQMFLGEIYEKGHGVEVNFTKAHFHYCVAETFESLKGRKLRLSIEKKLNINQISENYKRIRKLIKKLRFVGEFDEHTGLRGPTVKDLKKTPWLKDFFK